MAWQVHLSLVHQGRTWRCEAMTRPEWAKHVAQCCTEPAYSTGPFSINDFCGRGNVYSRPLPSEAEQVVKWREQLAAKQMEEATLAVELFKKYGIPCQLITVQGGIHGVINWEKDPKFQAYKTGMIDWLHQTLGTVSK